jgi:hypothetical protein
MENNLRVNLNDPGLVPNSADGEHCVHACVQMICRGLNLDRIPTFAQLDAIMDKKPGYYSWSYGIMNSLSTQGVSVETIQALDFHEFLKNPKKALIDFFGEEIGMNQFTNSDIPSLLRPIRRLLKNPQIKMDNRIPTFDDIKNYIDKGMYVKCYVNYYTLNGLKGYSGHAVLVYGYTDRGLLIHDPGPPAVEARKVNYKLFERAWGYPNDRARELYAFGIQ